MAMLLSLTDLKSNPGLRAQVSRYPVGHRQKIWRLSAHAPRRTDLIYSFPAAAIAIVSRERGDPVRKEAIRRVDQGLPLHDIADTLALPYWYRRLPPESFSGPQQGDPTIIAADARLGARILNHLPGEPTAIQRWFRSVGLAWKLGGEDFACWIASQPLLKAAEPPPRLPLQALALYSFHSQAPDSKAGALIGTRWSGGLGLSRAAGEARFWLLSVLQERGVSDATAVGEPRSAWRLGNHEIVALDTPRLICEEARAMRNCLRQYIGLVAWSDSRLFGIRLEGRRIATMEVRPHDARRTPRLHEIRGPMNTLVAADVIELARQWIREQTPQLRCELGLDLERHSEERFQSLVWRPFAGAVLRSGRVSGPLPPPSLPSILRETQALCLFEK